MIGDIFVYCLSRYLWATCFCISSTKTFESWIFLLVIVLVLQVIFFFFLYIELIFIGLQLKQCGWLHSKIALNYLHLKDASFVCLLF